MTRKGIILAGGRGTRLFPLTLSVSKQLLPVHDKPMIYYPLSTLMLAGIRDILVITTPRDAGAFKALLGDGSGLGIRLSYAVQPEPGGVAQALLIGDEFIGGNPVCLILGDNIFFGRGLASGLRQANARTDGATLFACKVADLERYGVVSLDRRGRATGIEEKPGRPKSNFAVTGVYFFDHGVGDIARQLRPSARGELEITDVLSAYLAAGTLRTDVLGRGMIWHDTGTHEALQRAASGVQALEARRGRKIACVEEVAWRMGFINDPQLRRLAEPLMKSGYGGYLQSLLNDVSLSQAV